MIITAKDAPGYTQYHVPYRVLWGYTDHIIESYSYLFIKI